ncbi:unnamed protein product (macronuclear) [Paramecium tetraurelia]|uniref:GOLD domain-containing protein n=2 Tax=Paramecium TaxID=5884 RepID=A0BDI7_PARTE|nr:uncharacterized protein GSPATT00027633001 [Paramecium tetraurelia]CAD8187806.1 unnamed protein product [Paramecium octaurelia]CAK56604.1 unnamed protein product [Paramecium tetraurelia]|eukprot:XP_001424002.1 hypothetical protein (macronuclear) [Paramecium tetraurelia strain d4-2]
MKYIILLALLFNLNQCISFYAKEGVEKCFSDEVPSQTIVVIYHELMSEGVAKNEKRDIPKMIKDGITLNVYGPDGNIVKTAKTVEGKNKLSFTAKTMGRYKFCVIKSKQFWSVNEYKYSIKIQQGVDHNLQDAANKTHVESIKDRISALKNRTDDFISLQQLNREQEDKLTTQSIDISRRVTQTTILQIVVLLASGVYQIWSLKKFFKQRFLM